MMQQTVEQFNNDRYGAYQSLPSEEHFFLDKVYLYKTYRELKKLFPNEQASVLEIGCADGSYSKFLKDKGFDITGIDISADAIELTKAKGIKAIATSAEESLPFEAHSFDAVIACETIEHLYDTDFFIKEILRVTKPGGWILLSTPNLASLKNRLRLLLGLYPRYSEYRLGDDTSGHVRNYTGRVLRKQLHDLGAQDISILSSNILFPMTKGLPLFLKKIAITLGDVFPYIGSHVIARARKA